MEKSNLAQCIEANLKARRENKAKVLCDGPYIYATDQRCANPFTYRSVLSSLSDRARFARQHLMYQMSGAMNSRDLMRFDPQAHGVADGH